MATKKCVNCNGSGEVEDNGPKACPACGGNGYIDSDWYEGPSSRGRMMGPPIKPIPRMVPKMKLYMEHYVERQERVVYFRLASGYNIRAISLADELWQQVKNDRNAYVYVVKRLKERWQQVLLNTHNGT